MKKHPQFAKLFDLKGRQLLVTKGEDTDGNPALVLRGTTYKSGHGLSLAIGFKGSEERQRKAVDAAFDNIDADKAWDLFNNSPGSRM